MKKTKRFISAVLAVFMLISTSALCVNAAGLSDISSHWAKPYIEMAVQRGYVTGYDDNTFRPGQPVTRAEFCKMLNNALGLSATASISFKDVPSTAWYYKEVQKAVSAGYIGGYDDNTFLGGNKITRQEAAVVISRIVTAPQTEKNIDSLKDSSTIASWALSGAKTVFSKGYMAGDNLGNFNPKGNLTRAEAVKIIESILAGEKISSASLTVNATGQTYSNWVITGNVITAPELSSGNVTFNNCRILGTMLVNGGGSSGIRLSGTTVSNMTINSNFQTGVAAVGNSTVSNTYVSTSATLVESSLTGAGAGFKNISLGGSLNQPVLTLSGNFDKVDVLAAGTVKLTSGSVSDLSVSSKASGSVISLSEGTSLNNASVNASCDFTGKGTILSVTENAEDVSYETLPQKINGEAPKTEPVIEPPVLTFAPKNGSDEFPIDSEIFITSDRKLLSSDGQALKSSYAESNIELRSSSRNGTKVMFDANVSADGKLLTIIPDVPLEPETAYYLIVKEGIFRSESGGENEEYVVRFQTAESDGDEPIPDKDDGEFPTPEVFPAASSKNIAVDANPKLRFSEPVYRKDGSALSTSYLMNALQLREDSASGKQLDFSVSLSKDKQTITIVPDEEFDLKTKYYVIVKADKLSDDWGNINEKISWSFTTSGIEGIIPEVTPPSGSGKIDRDTNFVFDFGTAIYDDWGEELLPTYLSKYAFTMYENDTDGDEVEISVTISKDKERLTVNPKELLKRSTRYIIVINEDMLVDKNDDPIPGQSFTFVTSDEMMDENDEFFDLTASSPEKGETEVAPDSSIILIYPEYLYDAEGSSLSAADVEEYVTIRKGSSTGSQVSYSATISSSKKIIELIPDKNLSSGTKYYVQIEEGAFTDKSGNMCAEHSFSFTVGTKTGGTLAPLDTFPVDGSTNTSTGTIIMMVFDEAITKADGSALSSSYLSTSALEIRRGSKNGARIDFGASIDKSGTIVTMMPTAPLSSGYIYYVTLLPGVVSNDDGELNDAFTFTFETK